MRKIFVGKKKLYILHGPCAQSLHTLYTVPLRVASPEVFYAHKTRCRTKKISLKPK